MADQSGEEGTIRYIRCPSCGTPCPEMPDGLCTRCGKPLHEAARQAPPPRPKAPQAASQVVCSNCHKELPPGSKFCGFCGAALSVTPPPAVAPKPQVRTGGPSTIGTPPLTPPVAPPKVAPRDPKHDAPTSALTPPRVTPPPPPPIRPGTRPPSPAVPPPPEGQGTQVFMGMRVPKIEAKILEVKQDGTIGKGLRIVKETFIGRGSCDASYPNDILLAPRHASITKREGKLFLKDLGTPNGTFVKMRQDTELSPGDVFLLGRELFRFNTQRLDETPASADGTLKMTGAPTFQAGPVTAKLEHIQLTGELIKEYSLDRPETTLGRTTGDMIFKDDPYMSGTHARIVAQPGRFVLQDLKSRNGVYRRIRDEIEMRDADEFFLGEQLFRVEIQTIEG
jgi:pSer/pThr/pTyr-binding forkhead associated (FHA) protein